MTPFILSFFNSIYFLIYSYFLTCVLLNKKQKNIKRNLKAFLSFFIVYYLILCLLDSVYAIFFSGLYAFLFVMVLFEENIFISLLISLIINTTKLFAKILVLLILNDESLVLMHTYKNFDLSAVHINAIAMVISIIFIFIFLKKIRKFIKWISNFKYRELILVCISYMNFITIIILQPPENIFSIPVIADFCIIFVVTAMGIFSMSIEKKTESIKEHYKEFFEYAKANEELLNDYKMQVHENKNKLLMIKGMLDSSNKEVNKYIDSILKETNTVNNYWLTELKHIPLLGVRNFINFKLIKMKDIGAEIEVFVSSELENIDATSLDKKEYSELTTILGIILDNMIESIEVTDEKLISINIYLENNKIHGEFANTFSGKVDIDRLYEVGYTTKGEKHGVGLPLVKKITKYNNRFECNASIFDNFFIQHLTVNLYKSNNIQKTQKNSFLSQKIKKDK